MPRWLALALALAWLAPCPALAEDAADITRQTLESGHLQSGEADLTARVAADPKDNEARFGLGMVLLHRRSNISDSGSIAMACARLPTRSSRYCGCRFPPTRRPRR